MNIIKEVKEKYLDFREVSAYKIAFDLSNYVWQLVVNWDWFAKRTVGSQFVESTGSISANIAEGYGRYFKKDKIKFYFYSRASAREASDWNSKALKRNLITEEQFHCINEKLEKLPKEINNLIRYTNLKLKV